MTARITPALILAAVAPLAAQEPADAQLGRVDFPTSCAASVQSDFNRAAALLHHMTYPVAYSAFEGVATDDPDCAMAYWGMAVTLFQPLWPTRPGAEEIERGWSLASRARALASGDPREDGFIAAAEAFFDPAGAPDYWTRIERWADAQERLYEAFPEDREVRAFFALAHLATASQSASPAAHHERAAGILAAILEEEPTHPGAVHYTIHANDFDGRERESLDVVRGYSAIAPRNPHALHMPTHIFVRLGDWDEVIAWNEEAAEAALAQRVGPEGEYIWDEYPHAVEYLVYALLQKGDDEAAHEHIDALHAATELQPSFKTAFHLASTSARYAVERRDWSMASALPARTPGYLAWDAFWWPEAVTWHARGLGAAHLDDLDATEASLRRMSELEELASAAGEAYFATQIRILRLEVSAWEALARGNRERAVARMVEAVRLEEETPKHPVTPGATVPAREMLGDLYFELGEYPNALVEYKRVIERIPARLNTVLGLARTSEALGDGTAALRYYRRVVDLAVPGSAREGVVEARSYLEAR